MAAPFGYVTNEFDNTVSVIDAASNTVVATIPVGTLPSAVAVTPNGAYAYVANQNGSTVSVIATASNTVVATIPVGRSPSAVAVTPNGAYAYVTNASGNTVSVIATASNTVVDLIPVGNGPAGIAFAPASPSVPFTTFSMLPPVITKNSLALAGDLTLGATSTGLSLPGQPLTLTLNSFSLTIPAGSFKQVGTQQDFAFYGTINGLNVAFTVLAVPGNSTTSFVFGAVITGVDLIGTPNPATVTLTIGQNTGTASVTYY
jgi:YVTN family beta-propeller protein